MKNFKFLALAILSLAVLNSCQKNELEPQIDTNAQEAPEHVIQKFRDLGVNPSGGVEPHTILDNNDQKVSGWLSGDIFLSKDDIINMPILPKEESAENEKLFRTRNLVRVPRNGQRTLRIRAVGLNSRLQTGLNRAIQNYNQLNLRFRMQLVNNRADITVRTFNGPAGGSAGFPSRGNPFGTVNIGSGSTNLSLGTIEHLMTHELGHCVGLRHSDFRIRFGCPNPGNEGDAGIGAIFIPGTSSTGRNLNSVMRACFTGNENGNFKQEDRVGLRRIY